MTYRREVSREDISLAKFALLQPQIENMLFEECIIRGPACVLPHTDVGFHDCTFDRYPVTVLDPSELGGPVSPGVIPLLNVEFRACQITRVTVLLSHDTAAQWDEKFKIKGDT